MRYARPLVALAAVLFGIRAIAAVGEGRSGGPPSPGPGGPPSPTPGGGPQPGADDPELGEGATEVVPGVPPVAPPADPGGSSSPFGEGPLGGSPRPSGPASPDVFPDAPPGGAPPVATVSPTGQWAQAAKQAQQANQRAAARAQHRALEAMLPDEYDGTRLLGPGPHNDPRLRYPWPKCFSADEAHAAEQAGWSPAQLRRCSRYDERAAALGSTILGIVLAVGDGFIGALVRSANILGVKSLRDAGMELGDCLDAQGRLDPECVFASGGWDPDPADPGEMGSNWWDSSTGQAGSTSTGSTPNSGIPGSGGNGW